MSDTNPFLESIIETPDDDTPRLVYADWLDDHGQHERAEFIRLSCRLSHLPRGSEGEQALMDRFEELQTAHAAEWFGKLLRLTSGVIVRSGFVENVKLVRQQLQNWKRIVELAPTIRTVVLRGAAGRIQPQEFLQSPHAARIEQLDIGGIDPVDVQLLADSARLPRLWLLKLNTATVDDVIALLGSKHLHFKRVLLHWYGNNLTCPEPYPGGLTLWVENFRIKHRRDSLPRLWACKEWRRVESLWMNNRKTYRDGVTDPLGEVLAGDSHLTNVRELLLDANGLDDAQIQALAGCPSLRNLETLDLYKNRIGDAGAEVIASTWPNLNRLYLTQNQVGSRGAQALAVGLRRPVELYLASNQIMFPGLAALASAPALAGLQKLALKGNPGGSLAAPILADSPYLKPGVVEVDTGTPIRADAVVEELCSQPDSGRITELLLSDYGITDRALEAIRDNPYLTNVKKLKISHCRIDRRGLDALADWPGLRSLETFSLSTNVNSLKCSGMDFDRLIRSPHWGALTEFSLGAGYTLRNEGAIALATAKFRSTLSTLWLGGHEIGLPGIRALAAAAGFDELQELNIRSNKSIGAEGFVALATSPAWPKLAKLSADKCAMGDDGLAALAASTSFPALTELLLGDNGIGDAGVCALADSPLLGRLTNLYLGKNKLTGAALRAFCKAGGSGAELELSLSPMQATDADVELLARSPFMSRLVRLGLRSCGLGSASTIALAESAYAANLVYLDLLDNPIEEPGLLALVQSSKLPRLKELAVDGSGCSEKVVGAILESPLCKQLEEFWFKYDGPSKEQLKEKFGKAIRLD